MYWGYNGSLVPNQQIRKAISYNKFICIKNSIEMSDHDLIFQNICIATSRIVKRSN